MDLKTSFAPYAGATLLATLSNNPVVTATALVVSVLAGVNYLLGIKKQILEIKKLKEK